MERLSHHSPPRSEPVERPFSSQKQKQRPADRWLIKLCAALLAIGLATGVLWVSRVDVDLLRSRTRTEGPAPRPADPSPTELRDVEQITRIKSLHASKRSVEARLQAIECTQRTPGLAECHKLIGTICAKLYEREASIRGYREYLRLAPQSGDAAVVQKILEFYEAHPRGMYWEIPQAAELHLLIDELLP